MTKTRVLLVDDHAMFRQGIQSLISREPDLQVVGETGDGAEAVKLAQETRPDVILMDISMPGLGGFAAAKQIKKDWPETKVLILSMYDDDEYLLEGIDAGTSGHVLKDSPAPMLLTAIREVQGGGNYLSPRMLSHLVDDFRKKVKSSKVTPRFATLTNREREVLKTLAEGKSVKEIACDLDLCVKTVEAHKFNLMRKLDIHNKAQLVQYAVQKKIIRIENMPDMDTIRRSGSNDVAA